MEPLELILATSRSISAPYSSDGTPKLRHSQWLKHHNWDLGAGQGQELECGRDSCTKEATGFNWSWAKSWEGIYYRTRIFGFLKIFWPFFGSTICPLEFDGQFAASRQTGWMMPCSPRLRPWRAWWKSYRSLWLAGTMRWEWECAAVFWLIGMIPGLMGPYYALLWEFLSTQASRTDEEEVGKSWISK